MSFNILSWNVRRAASWKSVKNVKNLIKLHKLHIVIVLEPRISNDIVDKICHKIGLPNFFRVKANGFSKGIWILWDARKIDLEIPAFSSELIHILRKISSINWLLTAIYGSPTTKERKRLWKSLCLASKVHDLPRMVVRDFNQVISQTKREEREVWI